MGANRQLKITFQKFKAQEDKRFTKGKLWLMHLGENFNGSIFTKEAVLKAMPSLANIPLLGFIADKGDKLDFAGHEEILVTDKDGNKEAVYLGSVYGIIPESCNPQIETRVGDDMVEREYLTVDCLLYNKFKSFWGVLLDTGTRPHSMELAEGYTGNMDANNFFVFDSFQFEGACILGVDVEPAMINSTLEIHKAFAKSLNTQIAEMIAETKTLTTDPVIDEVTEAAAFSYLDKMFATLNGNKDSQIAEFSKQLAKIQKILGGN